MKWKSILNDNILLSLAGSVGRGVGEGAVGRRAGASHTERHLYRHPRPREDAAVVPGAARSGAGREGAAGPPTHQPEKGKGLVINYGEGGLQNGKIAGPKLFAPPPQDKVKLFTPPLLKSGNFSCLPYNMAKTSNYCVKTTPKLFVPTLQHG